MPCPLTDAFIKSIEEFFPHEALPGRNQFKTTIGDLMLAKRWDQVRDNLGSWDGIKKSCVKATTTEPEMFARMMYALQLGVHEANQHGGRVIKKHPILIDTPDNFVASLAVLDDALEFRVGVATIKKEKSFETASYEKTREVVKVVRHMFESIGERHYGKIGRDLAKIFKALTLPRDMMLKTARKLLTL